MVKRRADREQLESDSRLPLICLGAMLIFQIITFIYPSGAYPFHGFVYILAVSVLIFAMGFRRLPIQKNVAGFGMGAGIFWLLFQGLSWLWAPVYSIARPTALTGILEGAVLLLTCFCAGSLAHLGRKAEAEGVTITSEIPSPVAIYTWAIGGVAAVLALYAIYQLLGPEGFPGTFATQRKSVAENFPLGDPMRDALLHALGEGRASGTLGAANIFASLCAFALPLMIAVAIGTRKMPARIVGAAASLILAAAILATGSQGGVLALAAAITAMVVLVVAYRISNRNVGRLALAAGAVFVVVAAAFILPKIFAPAENSRWLGHTGMTQRIFYWRTAISIWQDHPLIGAGPGGFEVFFPTHRIPGSNETKLAHSWFFAYLATGGIVGVLGFLTLVAGAVTCALKLLREMKTKANFSEYMMAAGLSAGCATILFHGLVEYTFDFRETALLFFTGAGILVGTYHGFIYKEKTENAGIYKWAGPLVLSFALCALGYAFQLRPAKASELKEEAQYLFEERASKDEVSKTIRDAVLLDVDNPELWSLSAFYAEQYADTTSAMKSYETAMSLNPYSAQLRESAAFFNLHQGRPEEALRLQREAVERHPRDTGHHLGLAEILWQLGRKDEAKAELLKTLDMKPTAQENEKREALATSFGIDLKK